MSLIDMLAEIQSVIKKAECASTLELQVDELSKRDVLKLDFPIIQFDSNGQIKKTLWIKEFRDLNKVYVETKAETFDGFWRFSVEEVKDLFESIFEFDGYKIRGSCDKVSV